MNRKILLGVSGGIAAYKSCEIVRRLKDQGFDVHVAMTKAACQLVTPLTFQALSGNPVHTELFDLEQESKINHIALADFPDLIVVAPATADLLAKVTHGLCDDLLSTVLCATVKPVLFCPSMNVNMWKNEATQANLALLKKRGFQILNPESGYLACGWEGLGRLPEPEIIVKNILNHFSSGSLNGLKIMITAGPTWEPIDPVRHLANPSSGKMGFALAECARDRGAEVVLISGPTSLPNPENIHTLRVKTAQEMAELAYQYFPKMNVAICTAAVSDFRVKQPLPQKAKKETASLTLELERNEDILAHLGQKKKKGQVLVGFAAETENLEKEALQKLKKKNLDLICGNQVNVEGLGFGSDENKLILLSKDGEKENLGVLPKAKLAELILDKIEKLI